MAVYLFDGDDAGYLKWTAEHQEGFVINTKRQDGARSSSIHLAGCAHIRVVRNQNGPGGFTERGGIKICSLSYEELITHVWESTRSPLLRVIPCKRCIPDKVEVVIDRSPVEVGIDHVLGRHAIPLVVNKYEFDPLARAECIRIHGPLCAVCHTDLEHVYGGLGRQAMRVHLVHPLGSLNEDFILDPVNDLVPICPNCHLIMHRGRDVALSIEDLRRTIAFSRAQWAKMRMATGQY